MPVMIQQAPALQAPALQAPALQAGIPMLVGASYLDPLS